MLGVVYAYFGLPNNYRASVFRMVQSFPTESKKHRHACISTVFFPEGTHQIYRNEVKKGIGKVLELDECREAETGLT